MVSSLKGNRISVNKFIHFLHIHLTLVFTNIEHNKIGLRKNSIVIEMYGYFASDSQLDRKHISHYFFDAMNTIYELLSNRTCITLLLSSSLANSTCFHRTGKIHGHFQKCKQIEKRIIIFHRSLLLCNTYIQQYPH